MAFPVNGSTHLIPALLLIYRPRKDERLSWPSWLTCSGWFTHISGQDREISPARDRRSTTVLRHQLILTWSMQKSFKNSTLFVSSTQAYTCQLDKAGLRNRGQVNLHVQSVIEVTFAVFDLSQVGVPLRRLNVGSS